MKLTDNDDETFDMDFDDLVDECMNAKSSINVEDKFAQDSVDFPPSDPEDEPVVEAPKRRGRKPKTPVGVDSNDIKAAEKPKNSKSTPKLSNADAAKYIYDHYSKEPLDKIVEVTGFTKNLISREVNKARKRAEELYGLGDITKDMYETMLSNLTKYKAPKPIVEKEKAFTITDLIDSIADKN